jgi:hypothetical protein
MRKTRGRKVLIGVTRARRLNFWSRCATPHMARAETEIVRALTGRPPNRRVMRRQARFETSVTDRNERMQPLLHGVSPPASIVRI